MTTSGPGPQPNDPYEPFPTAPPVDPRSLPQTPARPKQVDTAFTLWMVSAGLSLLGFVLTLVFGQDATREAARKSFEDTGRPFTEADVDTAVTAALIFTGFFALLFFGLYLLFAFKMRAGRNWARLTLAILGGLGLLYALYGLAAGGQGALETVVGIVQIALVGTAIYLMYTKESSAYFDAAKRAS
ncbi:hypothetical protein [Actinokineospora iranica]|uniref:Uncharacterized protein n=1 Tax=Actinokineospora iranica TaxID=1271860 RepID=A0A1G6URE5_9PSEU|nr:hypothetical protein [Actinokineospora iranica]SDD43276.1 hypothetical protein SAMN05216174_11134 [Actinokineospora iranica]